MSAYAARRERALRSLAELELEALVVSNPPNVRYLSGFTGEGLLLLSPTPVLCTDRRYEIEAAEEVADVEIAAAERGHMQTLLEAARPQPEARFVLAHSTTGYTTNLPLEDVTGGRAWVAWEVDGEPLPRGHGGPVRLIVPHLYFWKSAKWITRLELLARDQPGFWEQNGYHDRGDPWLEQRYQGDP